jgi:hypothetical protein
VIPSSTIWAFQCPCGRVHEYKRPVVSARAAYLAHRQLWALVWALLLLRGEETPPE